LPVKARHWASAGSAVGPAVVVVRGLPVRCMRGSMCGPAPCRSLCAAWRASCMRQGHSRASAGECVLGLCGECERCIV
jgi:hypothetical protein